MIVRSKAPLRLGLAGGGSDVSPYCDRWGGYVLNATINLSAYCSIETLPDNELKVSSWDSGVFRSVKPGEASGAILIDGVIERLARDYGYVPGGLSITTWNDAPAGSGLGTSSTMVVTILKCFAELLDLPLGNYELARLSYEIERMDLALKGGRQDQYAAAFGGFNFMEFLPEDLTIVNPLKVKDWIIEELEASLVLYYTGQSRSSSAIIHEEQKATIAGNQTAIGAMHRIRQSAMDMKLALLKGDMPHFAKILGAAWEDKKKMADAITNQMIQDVFDVAMAAGALSGKVSGAGGGGFIMLMTPPERRMAVIEALRQQPGKVVPFKFTDKGAVSWKL